eukprot:3039015-Pyramimonas_sp.AAC.1
MNAYYKNGGFRIVPSFDGNLGLTTDEDPTGLPPFVAGLGFTPPSREDVKEELLRERLGPNYDYADIVAREGMMMTRIVEMSTLQGGETIAKRNSVCDMHRGTVHRNV